MVQIKCRGITKKRISHCKKVARLLLDFGAVNTTDDDNSLRASHFVYNS